MLEYCERDYVVVVVHRLAGQVGKCRVFFRHAVTCPICCRHLSGLRVDTTAVMLAQFFVFRRYHALRFGP